VESSSRIVKARRRVRAARYAIGAGAVAGFAVFGAAVRDAHPATAHASSTVAVDSSTTENESDSFSFGTASVGDSGVAAPQIQSSGS
jgi:hypothetical protein